MNEWRFEDALVLLLNPVQCRVATHNVRKDRTEEKVDEPKDPKYSYR